MVSRGVSPFALELWLRELTLLSKNAKMNYLEKLILLFRVLPCLGVMNVLGLHIRLKISVAFIEKRSTKKPPNDYIFQTGNKQVAQKNQSLLLFGWYNKQFAGKPSWHRNPSTTKKKLTLI